MRRVFVLALMVYLLAASAAVAEPIDDVRGLIEEREFDTLLALYRGYSSRDDFSEIEAALLDLAKEQVVASEYEIALQVLEILLTVNLFNPDAQDVYVSVNSLLKGRTPGSDAPAVVREQPESAEATTEVASAPDPTAPVTVATSAVTSAPLVAATEIPTSTAVPAQPTETVPPVTSPSDETQETTEAVEVAQISPSEDVVVIPTQTTGETMDTPTVVAAVEPTVVGTVEPAAATVESTPVATVEPAAAVGEELLPVVTPLVVTRTRVPMTYETYAGPVSLLGNMSGFYSDFYGSGRFNLSYGVSLDASLLFHFPSLVVGPELSLDGHFANLTPNGGDQIAYKISANVGFPTWIDFPLFFRLGFTQQWYLFGADVPDVLITSFPSPTLGVKVAGIPLGGRLELDAAIDLYAISFFTSYFWLGMDAAASVDMMLPLTERLSLNPRVGLQPQILVANGNIEFLMKLELGIGVVTHEP